MEEHLTSRMHRFCWPSSKLLTPCASCADIEPFLLSIVPFLLLTDKMDVSFEEFQSIRKRKAKQEEKPVEEKKKPKKKASRYLARVLEEPEVQAFMVTMYILDFFVSSILLYAQGPVNESLSIQPLLRYAFEV